MNFIANYGLFLLKTATFVAAFLTILAAMRRLAKKGLPHEITIDSLNQTYKGLREQVASSVLSEPTKKSKQTKFQKQAEKCGHGSSSAILWTTQSLAG